MKIEIAGFINRKRILGIFLGSKGISNYSLSSEEVQLRRLTCYEVLNGCFAVQG